MREFGLGANLPWIDYGGDFGANAWHPEGGVRIRPERLARALDRVADAGLRRIRWFLLCDGRAGVRFDGDGCPVSLDEFVFADLDASVRAAAERDVQIMFVLIDFLWCARGRSVDGVQLGGRRDVLRDSAKRAALLDRIVRPILERYGGAPQIFAWDIINEPEWAIWRLGTLRRHSSIDLAGMQAFVRETAALIHECTNHSATVGASCARHLDLWRGLGLDVYQSHWYEPLERRAPLARPVSSFHLDKPVILGEFPSRVSADRLRDIIATARAAGYSEAFVWSAWADDEATDFAAAIPSLRAFMSHV